VNAANTATMRPPAIWPVVNPPTQCGQPPPLPMGGGQWPHSFGRPVKNQDQGGAEVKKIPTLFVRDPEDRGRVLPEVTPGCEWVLAGEGRATRKYDGTCVMFDGTSWWSRREVKPGKTPPPGWVEVDHDDTTGKRVGWEPAEQSSFAKFLQEAVDRDEHEPEPGTYELVGPKVNGNPEGFESHAAVRHGQNELRHLPLDFDGLAEWLRGFPYEGIVWHHPDGRMAKLKRRDFV
jgi:hypothetical protein